MARHFHDSYRGDQPTVLLWLIGLALFGCVWNLGTTPTSDERRVLHASGKAIQQSHHAFSLPENPLQHGILQWKNVEGHHVILIPSHRRQMGWPAAGNAPIILLGPENENFDSIASQGKESTTAANQPSSSRINSEGPSFPRLRYPETLTERMRPSAMGTFQAGRFTYGTIMLLGILGSVALGGVAAKRALDRVYQWEQQEQEDSLAYDIAYTTSVSEIGYGSFVSSWTGDLDKFDV